MTDDYRQSIVDAEHLRLLSIGYKISAAISALFSLFGLLYVAMGLLIALIPPHASTKAGEPPPEIMGWIFGFIGLMMFLLMVGLAIAKFIAANKINQRRSKTFCLVVAGISCLGIPYGTLLGVASFIVLQRPSVARQFDPKT